MVKWIPLCVNYLADRLQQTALNRWLRRVRFLGLSDVQLMALACAVLLAYTLRAGGGMKQEDNEGWLPATSPLTNAAPARFGDIGDTVIILADESKPGTQEVAEMVASGAASAPPPAEKKAAAGIPAKVAPRGTAAAPKTAEKKAAAGTPAKVAPRGTAAAPKTAEKKAAAGTPAKVAPRSTAAAPKPAAPKTSGALDWVSQGVREADRKKMNEPAGAKRGAASPPTPGSSVPKNRL